MKKKIIYKGVATALITPFSKGKIDYPSFEKLINAQIEAKIPALVIGGTTGEAATLSCEERYSLFKAAKSIIGNRSKLIFGTGTNDTKMAIKHTRFAEELGCDAVLVVTPYYNKGTDDGLVRHYHAIANSVDLPIIVYNVPSRTGVNLSISQLKRIAEKENIVGLKEASDSQDRLMELSLLSDKLTLYTGSDSAIYSTLALGGAGVISVISNFCPRTTQKICDNFFSGDTHNALKIQKMLLPAIKALFAETSPAPIKYALSKIGYCENELRLPLSPVSSFCEKLIEDTLMQIEDTALEN